MKRRALLAAVGTTALAGCTVGYTGRREPVPATPTPDAGSLAEQGFPSTVCEEELKPNLIPAIDDPAFGSDWSHPGVPEKFLRTGGLTDDRQVVGIARDGVARAYPLAILRRNEVVNDRFDVPVLVTYCPLCRSGMVTRREVAGEETVFGGPASEASGTSKDSRVLTFGVSGLLWKPPDAYAAASEADGTVFVAGEGIDPDAGVRDSGNLVLYDLATRSRWSQLLARAICGPRTGDRFEILPSTVATWGEWRAEHPDTEVLLPPPLSGTL